MTHRVSHSGTRSSSGTRLSSQTTAQQGITFQIKTDTANSEVRTNHTPPAGFFLRENLYEIDVKVTTLESTPNDRIQWQQRFDELSGLWNTPVGQTVHIQCRPLSARSWCEDIVYRRMTVTTP